MRKVNREGFVSFDGAKYGVPWQYSGKEVRVRILSGSFEVYDGEGGLPVIKQRIYQVRSHGCRVNTICRLPSCIFVRQMCAKSAFSQRLQKSQAAEFL